MCIHRRRNERDVFSNHWHLNCLPNRLFMRRSNETSKLRVTGLCEGNSRRLSFHLMMSSWVAWQAPKRTWFASWDAQSILNDKSVSCHLPRRIYMYMCICMCMYMYMYIYMYMYMYMICIYDVTWSITIMSLDDFIRNQKLVKKCIQMIHDWVIFRTTKQVN